MMASRMQAEWPQPAWLSAKTQPGSLEAVSQPEITAIQQALAYGIAYRLLHSKDAATDAVQESFLKAYRALSTFRGGRFKSWLLRIVVNTCYDLLALQRRQAVVSLSDLPVEAEYLSHLTDPAERPDAYAERMELRHRIEIGLRALPPAQRTTIVLCDIHGYSYAEIADMLGVAMGADGSPSSCRIVA
jgi:RNA polymerase sigma-70 factor, ECF subfamily